MTTQKQSRPLLAKLNEDYPKIRDVSDCSSLINYLITLFNIKTASLSEEKDLDIQMLVLIDFMRSEFGFLTTEEIREAFKMYVGKKFGHKDIYRILDTIVVSDVLNCFVDFRGNSLRTYEQKKQNLLLKSKNDLTDSEKDKLMIDAINSRYCEFLDSGSFSEPINHIFDELIQRKIIKMPTSENPEYAAYYLAVLEKAKGEIERELKSETALTKKEKNSISEELKNIQNNCSSKVELRAKKIVLTDFFNKQKKLNKTKIL